MGFGRSRSLSKVKTKTPKSGGQDPGRRQRQRAVHETRDDDDDDGEEYYQDHDYDDDDGTEYYQDGSHREHNREEGASRAASFRSARHHEPKNKHGERREEAGEEYYQDQDYDYDDDDSCGTEYYQDESDPQHNREEGAGRVPSVVLSAARQRGPKPKHGERREEAKDQQHDAGGQDHDDDENRGAEHQHQHQHEAITRDDSRAERRPTDRGHAAGGADAEEDPWQQQYYDDYYDDEQQQHPQQPYGVDYYYDEGRPCANNNPHHAPPSSSPPARKQRFHDTQDENERPRDRPSRRSFRRRRKSRPPGGRERPPRTTLQRSASNVALDGHNDHDDHRGRRSPNNKSGDKAGGGRSGMASGLLKRAKKITRVKNIIMQQQRKSNNGVDDNLDDLGRIEDAPYEITLSPRGGRRRRPSKSPKDAAEQRRFERFGSPWQGTREEAAMEESSEDEEDAVVARAGGLRGSFDNDYDGATPRALNARRRRGGRGTRATTGAEEEAESNNALTAAPDNPWAKTAALTSPRSASGPTRAADAAGPPPTSRMQKTPAEMAAANADAMPDRSSADDAASSIYSGCPTEPDPESPKPRQRREERKGTVAGVSAAAEERPFAGTALETPNHATGPMSPPSGSYDFRNSGMPSVKWWTWKRRDEGREQHASQKKEEEDGENDVDRGTGKGGEGNDGRGRKEEENEEDCTQYVALLCMFPPSPRTTR